MSKTSTSTISVTVLGDGTSLTDSDTVVDATSAVAPTSASLSAGANTISVPSGVNGVKIKPLPSNVVTLTLKGVTGDTGVPISPSQPSYLALPTGASTFVITAGGSATVLLVWC